MSFNMPLLYFGFPKHWTYCFNTPFYSSANDISMHMVLPTLSPCIDINL